jgi:hypothetical protein
LYARRPGGRRLFLGVEHLHDPLGRLGDRAFITGTAINFDGGMASVV